MSGGRPRTRRRSRPPRCGIAAAAALVALGALAFAGCGADDGPAPAPSTPAPAPPAPTPVPPPCAAACFTDGEVLAFGFFSDFEPVSYAGDRGTATGDLHAHRGYEADLLTALEAMEGAGLLFERRAVDEWPGIWLLPATPDFDMVGGGITALEQRTRDASGEQVVAFTTPHIGFRQSLLVRAADASRLGSFDDLTSRVKVGVLLGTTGEARLLRLTGLADPEGALAPGVRILTSGGERIADGTADYRITAAGASPNLDGRTRLTPPSPEMPEVVIFPGGTTREERFLALALGTIDAHFAGEIGHRTAVAAYGGAFALTAVDSEAEDGGFALDIRDTDLLACLDPKIHYLTDGRRLGFADWSADPSVFLGRAEAWICGES